MIDMNQTPFNEIKLILNKFLLNAILENNTLTIFYRQSGNKIPVGSIKFSENNYSDVFELSRYLETEILSYYPKLPRYCSDAYNICNIFTKYVDNLFLTHRKHILTYYTPSGYQQSYLLNNNIYDFLYLDSKEMRNKPIVPYDYNLAVTYKSRFVGFYDTFENKEILTRKIIYDIYENGFEDISSLSL